MSLPRSIFGDEVRMGADTAEQSRAQEVRVNSMNDGMKVPKI